MKKNIYLYLFVFSALLFLFQWVSGSRQFKAMDERIQTQNQSLKSLRDSLGILQERLENVEYFTLDNNEEALTYLDPLGLENPSDYIRDQVMETNAVSGSNPLVPFQGMNGDFKINRVQVINHKFLLADFSDSSYWGDMVVRYEFDEQGRIQFEVIDQLLYPQP